jgi:hypothetical protein
MGRSETEGLSVVRWNMTALILALIALGTLFGLIVRAAKKAPQEYVDLMIMTEERHAKENDNE